MACTNHSRKLKGQLSHECRILCHHCWLLPSLRYARDQKTFQSDQKLEAALEKIQNESQKIIGCLSVLSFEMTVKEIGYSEWMQTIFKIQFFFSLPRTMSLCTVHLHLESAQVNLNTHDLVKVYKNEILSPISIATSGVSGTHKKMQWHWYGSPTVTPYSVLMTKAFVDTHEIAKNYYKCLSVKRQESHRYYVLENTSSV